MMTCSTRLQREVIETENLLQQSEEKGNWLKSEIASMKNPHIKEIRGKGLMLAAMVESSEMASQVILKCLEKGLLLYWLLLRSQFRMNQKIILIMEQLKEELKEDVVVVRVLMMTLKLIYQTSKD